MRAPLNVALVEPQIPPNTGNVARLCAATGCALHLVEPLGFRIDDRELKRAGLDYWKNVNITVHPSFDDFMDATSALALVLLDAGHSQLHRGRLRSRRCSGLRQRDDRIAARGALALRAASDAHTDAPARRAQFEPVDVGWNRHLCCPGAARVSGADMSLQAINRRVVQCARCPELRSYCAQIASAKKLAYADSVYWGKPVPSFGDPAAQVMLVGLAPGAHGSNRTGRPFTGDGSGKFLYPALFRAGLASQPTALARDDGLQLQNCMITAAVRCAPPANKPTPHQLVNCPPYLAEEFTALAHVRVIVALGAIALRAVLKMLRDSSCALAPERPTFGHGVESVATGRGRRVTVIASFHPSQQNTNTGKLTAAMFDRIFERVNEILVV